MRKSILVEALLLAYCVGPLTLNICAQTTVTTTGGTANVVPKFSGTATLVNSAITESSGNVGVGTTSPINPLTLVENNAEVPVLSLSNLDSTGNSGNTATQITFIGPGRTWNVGLGGPNETQYGIPNKFFIFDSGASAIRFAIDTTGKVGIGTTAPGERLEVNGGIKLTSGSGGSITFADGTVQNTAPFVTPATGTATNIGNFDSGSFGANGSYWTGSVSNTDNWAWSNVLGAGANPTSTLTFTHTGSTGEAVVSVPKLIVAGGIGAVGISPNLFSALPTCNSGAEGTMAPVTDSTTNTWGATITGSGSDHVLGYCDGTNWTVVGK